MIAVCLLTADRLDYTTVTLESFARHNDPRRFALLHGDDASKDARVPALAKSHGFQTVVQSTKRRGWLRMRLDLFLQAQKRGADWILFLENDIEWARAFPWALFDFLVAEAPAIYCLRLQGAFKGWHQTDPCMTYHKGDRTRPVKWKPIKRAPEPAEVGCIHWSAQPCVTKTQQLLNCHLYNWNTRERTARVVENVTYHIGVERTGARQKPKAPASLEAHV